MTLTSIDVHVYNVAKGVATKVHRFPDGRLDRPGISGLPLLIRPELPLTNVFLRKRAFIGRLIFATQLLGRAGFEPACLPRGSGFTVRRHQPLDHLPIAPAHDSACALTGGPPGLFVSPELAAHYCHATQITGNRTRLP